MTLYNPSHERTSKLTSKTTIGDDCIHNFTRAAIIIAYKISVRLMPHNGSAACIIIQCHGPVVHA